MRNIVCSGTAVVLTLCAVVHCDGSGTAGGDAGVGDGPASDAGGADVAQSESDAGVDMDTGRDAAGDSDTDGSGFDAGGETDGGQSADVGDETLDVGAEVEPDAGEDASSPDAGGPDGGAEDGGGISDGGGLGPYAVDGPGTFFTFSIDIDYAGHTFNEHIYVPDTAGPHPVVVLRSATQQPASAYVSYCNRLASHGFVVLARDDPGPLVNTKVVVADIEHLVLTWLPAQNADPQSGLYGRVDLSRVGLAGHSRGGKASLLAAEGGLKGHVVAWFGIDMIDVTFIDDGIYAVTDVANVGIPTTFLVATVESNCSPAANNGQALFALAPPPSVLLLALGAGHTQFEDPAGCLLCSACTPAGTADQAVVEEYARRYLTAFFARELSGDGAVGPAFEGAGVAQDVAAGLIEAQTK